MASRQSVSSILKPPKIRAPLKEIEPVDQDADENTATSSKRKVSFSGMNKIKMYNTCATSLTVNQAPMFDEKISISSDSLNGDKTKLSGKFEKSDGQITFESTDCTNVEDNGRVIIEYESPSDNMEMTEAKVGKLYDSMFIIDNHDSEHINNSSLDDSETNMEFTEAIQVGRIITVDMESDYSSTETELMSETLSSEDEKHLNDEPSKQLSNDLSKNVLNKSSNSSNMEFTCTNTKSNLVGIDSSNMELTCMTAKSQKSALNDDYKSFNMELTQVTDRIMSEDYNEYESIVEHEVSYESKKNDNDESEIEQNLLFTKTSEVNNSTMVSKLKNVDDNVDNAVRLSLSMVSMDIDPTLECNEYEKNNIIVDNSEFIVNEQNCSSSVEMPMEIQEMSPKKINKSLVSEISLKQSFNAHASMFDPNQYILKNKSIVLEENQQSEISKNAIILSAPLIVEIDHEPFTEYSDMSIETEESQPNKCSTVPISDFNQSQSFENEDLSEDFATKEENPQKSYSRKSIASKSVFNQSQSYKIQDTCDKSIVCEENQQQMYSIKSIASTNMVNKLKSYNENEDLSNESAIDEEIPQKNSSRKSMASKSVFNQSQSYEIQDTCDKSIVSEENQQKMYSRKSIASTNIVNELKSYNENEDLFDESAIDEEIPQKNSSRKCVASKSVFNQSQSYEIQNACDISTVSEENQQRISSRKSIASKNIVNKIQPFPEKEDLSNKSINHKVNYQKNYSRKTITSSSVFDQNQSFKNKDVSNNTSEVENNQQKTYSRKSIVSTSNFNESALDTFEKLLESEQNMCSIESVAPILNHNQSCSLENENDSNISIPAKKNVQKKYSRKSVGPGCFFNKALEDQISDTLSSNPESNVSHISSNSDVKQSDISNHYQESLTQKINNQSALLNMISDDDLNSPFRKKSRKSVILSQLKNQPVEHTLPPSNDQENLLKTTGDQSENVEFESEMDISMEYESKTDDANISSRITNTSESISREIKKPHVNNENHDSIYSEDEKIVTSNELEKNELVFNELAENRNPIDVDDEKNENKTVDESTQIIDDVNNSNHVLNSEDLVFSNDIDKVTNTICVEGISNMSITDEKYLCIDKSEDKSFVGNRKRSYSNRDCVPLSCSSFVTNSKVEKCTNEDVISNEEFLKESPIKINDVKENTINDSVMVNLIEEDFVKNESLKENLNNEVLDFLARWSNQFVEKKLSLDKCTNKEWIFNVLDSCIILTISYSPISNDVSFLKVENISFSTNTVCQNDIMKFGVNWILSKYNPKVYKQICYTARDVELLLKCLLEDVDFISKMMKNMALVRDIYFVTFKDNKAEFVLHKMTPPMMVRIEILLSNIHKLSIKDINVDCFFGSFNSNFLNEALQNVNKDFKVLQSFIETLRNLAL